MKKLILSAFAVVASVALVSAQNMPSPFEPNIKHANEIVKPKSGNHNKANISDWYIVEELATKTNIGASLTNTITFMYHDSVAKLIYSNGNVQYNSWQGVGHVMDPKDDLIQQTNNPGIQLSQFVSYKLDSIRFPFMYVRHVDSIDDGIGGNIPVVDTLFVFYYRGSQIQKTNFTQSGNKVAITGYNHPTRMPANYFDIDTLLLTKEDSTGIINSTGPESSFSIRVMTLPAPDGMTIDANNGLNNNNLIAASYVFKSGAPTLYNGGTDTAVLLLQQDPANYPGIKRGNCWGYRYLMNGDEASNWNNPTFYNTSQFAIKWQSYGQDAGWRNVMVSGNAFVAERWLDMDFHITTTSDNVGINDIKNERFALSSVYPNPATTADRPVIAFNLKDAATVNVSIVNLVGQQVKDVFTKKFQDGAHAEFVDVTGLKPGVYFVTMNVNGSTISKKLTITQ